LQHSAANLKFRFKRTRRQSGLSIVKGDHPMIRRNRVDIQNSNATGRDLAASVGRKASAVIMASLMIAAYAGEPRTAAAATGGVSVTAVNMRAGPSTQYPVVTVMPQNASLTVYGCMNSQTWCDVSWGRARGWVSANYIYVVYKGQQTVLTASIIPVVGIATVAFSVAYWDRHYHGQPWHGHWDRYHHHASRSVAAGCNDRGCAAASVTRGPHGGGRSVVVGGDGNGNGGGAAVTRGPHGGGRAVVGGCGPEKCAGASVTRGPRGNTAVHHGVIDRRR
jgi:uncharacterized protein YraI